MNTGFAGSFGRSDGRVSSTPRPAPILSLALPPALGMAKTSHARNSPPTTAPPPSCMFPARLAAPVLRRRTAAAAARCASSGPPPPEPPAPLAALGLAAASLGLCSYLASRTGMFSKRMDRMWIEKPPDEAPASPPPPPPKAPSSSASS